MVQVVWTRSAASDLRAIQTYVAEFSPLAAQRLASRLIAAARSLESSPDRGRAISRGRRELMVIPPYLIRYVSQPDRVVILEIRHGAREPD
ncbi:type II toxin-antitoxin system RelE/ParE family toxin [Caulobacter endophyticus]|uniref:Addiction module toxin RelE n=1 Tax=Caulobacter endophyticus TaxID=2172652 RepID=A0A2T9JS19_9CAUL|nr:type II toxin-antitoxin system RelE/ParE family toxin [Caulobacter endophyticus]PVM86500.1 addiction module toxin RelE [Caulobacter endophyticus]